jgi:hypothetical protein
VSEIELMSDLFELPNIDWVPRHDVSDAYTVRSCSSYCYTWQCMHKNLVN